ncbi:hypothetical protein E2C01_045738 [Portunus trituberculatus]|uniref:Uncharacterized protein n=1 Tax=Portunus trituberculatus TaxID=210409 RepID=A0A5B7FWK0_PORTR|nr:hypothetical protein [Portunus trituberculatus]
MWAFDNVGIQHTFPMRMRVPRIKGRGKVGGRGVHASRTKRWGLEGPLGRIAVLSTTHTAFWHQPDPRHPSTPAISVICVGM